MTGELEEILGNWREGKKKDTNSESNFTDFDIPKDFGFSHIDIHVSPYFLFISFFFFSF